MAKYNLDKYTKDNGFGMSLNIRRGDPNPLDNSSVWPSLTEAQTYAQTDPTAYVGQVLTVVTTEGTTKTSKVYVINNEAGDLVEVTGTVDAALDAESANPVQNKAISAALNAKVDKDAVPEYTVVKDVNSGDYAAIYHLTKDGSNVGAAINIPRDMVVKSGEVVTNPSGQTAGTYIKIELQNVNEPLYINVGSLIEYVTSGSNEGDMVVVSVDDNHKVTATITDGTITLQKLHKDVQDAIPTAEGLTNMIDSALAQAKASGEFDGESVTHSWDGTTLTVTSASGTSSADLKGEHGASGVYIGSEEPPADVNVWIDPTGEVATFEMSVTFADGTTKKYRVYGEVAE